MPHRSINTATKHYCWHKPLTQASPCSQLQAQLPAAKEGGEPLPEGLLWLLLTNEVRCRRLRYAPDLRQHVQQCELCATPPQAA